MVAELDVVVCFLAALSHNNDTGVFITTSTVVVVMAVVFIYVVI